MSERIISNAKQVNKLIWTITLAIAFIIWGTIAVYRTVTDQNYKELTAIMKSYHREYQRQCKKIGIKKETPDTAFHWIIRERIRQLKEKNNDNN